MVIHTYQENIFGKQQTRGKFEEETRKGQETHPNLKSIYCQREEQVYSIDRFIQGQNGIFYNDLLIKYAVNASNLHVIFINHFIWIYFVRIWREPGPATLCNLKKETFLTFWWRFIGTAISIQYFSCNTNKMTRLDEQAKVRGEILTSKHIFKPHDSEESH